MDDFHSHFGFLVILRESIKIMPRNGRLMALVAAIHLLLYSLISFFFIFSTKHLVYDLLQKEINLSSVSNLQEHLLAKLLIGIQKNLTTGLALFVLSIFTQTATILISAMSYVEKKLSFKDLGTRVARSWTRLFITSFHLTLYIIGFTFFAFAMVVIPPLTTYNLQYVSYAMHYLLSFFAVILYLKFSVVWILALVISVIEESCGIEALGRASGLVKGKTAVNGFILNLFFTLLSVILIYCARATIVGRSPSTVEMILGMFLISGNCLVNMFQCMVYTELYLECKKNEGEGPIELRERTEYSKIPNLPLVNQPQSSSIYKNLFMYYLFQFF